MTKEGYIYVVEDESDICKIGYSKRSPVKRNYQLSTTYHKDFKFCGFFKSDSAKIDETIIHDLLKEYRIRGEWFKLSYDKIKELLSNYYTFISSELLEEEIDDYSRRLITFRLPPDILNKLDEKRKEQGWISRNAWILQMIQKGINE